MASYVHAAFCEFLRDYVDLDAEQTIKAKASRDWLVSNVNDFPTKDTSFPELYQDRHIFFGSFERKTKKRPLDDIDIMVCIAANGATYETSLFGDAIYMTVHNSSSNLRNLCFDDSSRLNSRKVVNKFVSMLGQVPQYRSAEIKRNGEAATVKLLSYDWNFDIVPCFFTAKDQYNKDFYIIPDGNGNWKKTDPRMDRDRVTRLVNDRGNEVLTTIRLAKYWNGRPTMPSMPSYLLENMVLDFFEKNAVSEYPDFNFKGLMQYLQSAIFMPVNDPKGIQGNINTLEIWDTFKISSRCQQDHRKAIDAWDFEQAKDQKAAINKWREIFGNCFPEFN